jgi:hypothetical protein
MSSFCFALTCDLKLDAPQQGIDTLRYMTGTHNHEFNNPPDAEFFQDDDWRTFLVCDSSGFVFPGEAHASLLRAYRHTRPFVEGGEDVFVHTLSFRCQGYDEGIIYHLKFLEWLAQYSSTKGFVGYFIYEHDENPTLIYLRDGLIYTAEPQRSRDIHNEELW